MENTLKLQQSKYLARHALNPILWQPYTAHALELAKRLDKPIYLSTGYSACHYCALMEKESFEDEAIANIINEHFIPILIDKDEMPDIDKEYQFYLQASGDAGGWPLNVFLTPDLEPFFAGTYFPKTGSADKPAFSDVLKNIANIYKNKKEEVQKVIDVRNEFMKSFSAPLETLAIGVDRLKEYATLEYKKILDPEFGGFRDGAKFPYVPALMMLTDLEGDEQIDHFLALTANQLCTKTICDHLFGGFFRYTTDRKWLDPHYEKMLTDNALVSRFLLKMYNTTGNHLYLMTAKKAIDFIINNLMTDYGILNSVESDTRNAEGLLSEGYFYKVTDRDFTALSEGELKNFPQDAGVENGMIYLKSSEYIKAVALQPTLDKIANRVAGVKLPPETDNKIVSGANFLFCTALLDCFEASGDEWFLNQATALFQKISYLMVDNGLVYRCCYGEEVFKHITLEDHVYYLEAVLKFYELAKEREFQMVANRVVAVIEQNFMKDGMLYIDQNKTIKDTFDDDKPNAIGLYSYLLSQYAYALNSQISDELKQFMLDRVNRFPTGHPSMVRAYLVDIN